MTEKAVAELTKRISVEWGGLLVIKARYHAMEAFQSELNRVRRGKRFRHLNTIIWRMAVDATDMLVIDLEDWTSDLWAKGGLFGQLGAHHSNHFRRKRKRSPDEDSHEAAEDDGYYAAAFARLFPDCKTPVTKPSDIKALGNSMFNMCADLQADRNENRAHNRRKRRKRSIRVRRLDLPDLAKIFDRFEQVLEDLSMIGTAISHAASELIHGDKHRTAQELVDCVLFGSASEGRRLVDHCGSRDALFDRLHSLHDDTDRGLEFFNDARVELDF